MAATPPPHILNQLNPPSPAPLTELNLPDQSGKVFIVTGGNAGVGLELVRILYEKNATVYIAGRSASKGEECIQTLQASHPTSSGKLKYLHLDLNDLSTIKATAQSFAAQEDRLDVLYNNAGIGSTPPTDRTAQGHNKQMGINCLGPYLLSILLLPQLKAAASSAPPNTVRVIWTSSVMVDLVTPYSNGITYDELTNSPKDGGRTYSLSKAGNWILAAEFAKRFGPQNGIVSITQNPGNLKTAMWDSAGSEHGVVLFDAKFGAYTELWAGLAGEITVQDGVDGKYVIPWGAWHTGRRQDVLDGLKSESEGGTGLAEKFWKWCEEQTKEFV